MTLIELQKILGERIALANDKTLTPEERKREADISQTISSLAKQMINNGDLILRTEKLLAMTKNLKTSYAYLLINGTTGEGEIE